MYAQLVHENPNVYQIQVPFANVITTETNCYVIVDDGDALVVDSGAPTDATEALLREALHELGIDPASARYFLTHAHYDHAGLVPRLAGKHAVVYVNAAELGALKPGFGRECTRYTCRRFLGEGIPSSVACVDNGLISVSVLLNQAALDVRRVREGDQIEVGRYRFSVVDVPGHTHGHMALFHPQSGICFTGDHVLFLITPSIPLYPDFADCLSTYFRSLDKLAKLGCTRLFISHGENRLDFPDRIEVLKGHHLKREDVIMQVVEAAEVTKAAEAKEAREAADAAEAEGADAVGLTGCEIIRRIPWRIPFARVDDCDPLQRWSIYSQGVVLLDHMVARGRLRRVDVPAKGVPASLSCCGEGIAHPGFVSHYVIA